MTFEDALTIPRVAQALGFAVAKRGNQKYGDKPYQEHLLRVAQVVYDHGREGGEGIEVLLQAALLHDTLEDTETTEAEIAESFGLTVLGIVKACTKKDEDLCRRCSFRRTVPALKNTPGALAVKLADRFANMQNSLETRSTHLNMYVREYAEFKNLLFVPGQYERLWQLLDGTFEAGVARKK